MPPGLLVGPTMTTLTPTRVNQDETTGITYVNTVTATVGLVALEMSGMMVDPNMPTLEGGAQGERLSSQMSLIHERQMTTLNKNVYGILA